MEVILWIIALMIIICLVVKNRADKRQIEVYQSFHRAIASALAGKDLTLKEPPRQFPSSSFNPAIITEEFRMMLGPDGKGPNKVCAKYFPRELSLTLILDWIEFIYCLSTAKYHLESAFDTESNYTNSELIADDINDFLSAVRRGFRYDVAHKLFTTDPTSQFTEPLLARLAEVASDEGNHAIAVFSDAGLRKVIRLDESSATIGQSAHNDICLIGEQVEAEHATIIFYSEGITVTDHDSDTGTFINGEKIIKQTIKKGDILSIGQYQLKILA